MAKRFYFDAKLGKSSNTGTSPFEPLRNSDDYAKLTLDPGDSVAFHAGQDFEGNFVHTRSGDPTHPVAISTYWLGGERARWATLKADSTATRPIAFDVNASYVDVDHLTAHGASYAGFVFREKQAHINGAHLRMRQCGIGARLRGSFTKLTHADSQDGSFSRAQNLETDEGGVAFSAESGDGHLNTDNTIEDAYVQGAVAASADKIDGGPVELFGDIARFTVRRGTFVFGKGGVEGGGPTRQAGQVPALAQDILFENNLFINCGILLQINDPAKSFPIRLKNWVMRGNTAFDRTRNLTAVWIQGAWSKEALAEITFDHNIYDGLGAWIGSSSPTTDLNSIKHTGNVYRSLNNKSVGYPLGVEDYVGDPLFVNPDALDFRLTQRLPGMPFRPGALDMALPYTSLVDLQWLLKQTRTPLDSNTIIGGHHSYRKHREMWAIPMPLRRAGMTCAISDYDQVGRLDSDLLRWWIEEAG